MPGVNSKCSANEVKSDRKTRSGMVLLVKVRGESAVQVSSSTIRVLLL